MRLAFLRRHPAYMQCYAKQGRKEGTQGNATIKTGLPCKYYRIFQVKFSTKKSIPNALGIPLRTK
jgi:hypothetical protein